MVDSSPFITMYVFSLSDLWPGEYKKILKRIHLFTLFTSKGSLGESLKIYNFEWLKKEINFRIFTTLINSICKIW